MHKASGPTGFDRDRARVLCLGETMALLTPESDLRTDPRLHVHQAGAEGNVAAGLAHLGCQARWVSRLGADEFAPVITDFLAARGVDVASVVIDPHRPTGLMVKTVRQGRTHVRYARQGSAASALSMADLDDAALADVAVCHLSGITPALSPEASTLAEELLLRRRLGPVALSFDVNYRPALWPDGGAAERLRELADAADVVFVGLDEAGELWGCTTPHEVRQELPGAGRVIVKDGAVAAHEFLDDGQVSVPALRAEVVEVVGAGDAFAAGYLAALTRYPDGDPELRLRLGHVLAACTLQSVLDLPAWPPADQLWAWARSDEAAWQARQITPDVLARS